MDNWLSELIRRLPTALAIYAVSVAAMIGLARLSLPLLFAVLGEDLPAEGVTKFLILILAWSPAVATVIFFAFVLAYLCWFYGRSKWR